MSYDTFYFALFLAATWAAFVVLPWRGYVLLLASIGFYAVAGLRDSLLAAAVILVNYGFQFAIMRDRRWFSISAVLPISNIGYFSRPPPASTCSPSILSFRSASRSIFSS